LQGFKKLCVTIWRDSLGSSDPYSSFLQQLIEIGKDSIPLSNPWLDIKDGYNTVGEDEWFDLVLISNDKTFSKKILKGKKEWRIDFGFLSIILEAQNASDSQGSYYLVDNEHMEEGISLIYLDAQEHSEIKELDVLYLEELTEELIDRWRTIFIDW